MVAVFLLRHALAVSVRNGQGPRQRMLQSLPEAREPAVKTRIERPPPSLQRRWIKVGVIGCVWDVGPDGEFLGAIAGQFAEGVFGFFF